MGIWSRVFPPKEVKASLLALSIQVDRLSENSCLYSAINIVAPKVKDAIEALPEKVKSSIMSDGFSPDELVRIMIRNCTHDEIASGRFHVYRGVLSLEGKYLLSLWNHFVDEFVAEGKMTEDERRSDREYLSEQISSAG